MFKNLGFGLGLRPDHYSDILGNLDKAGANVNWFEIITENFMGIGGLPRYHLDQIKEKFPIACHGVALSLGSSDGLDKEYLKKFKKFINELNPDVISDHSCWVRSGKVYTHDLNPLPYTEDAVKTLVQNIKRVQEAIGRRILIENVSSYIEYTDSTMTEWDFLSEVIEQADCGILLDINNVYVSSVNHQFDPMTYIRKIPKNRIGQIHLAGYSTKTSQSGKRFLIDTHDHPVSDEVWSLYRESLKILPKISTMIEWDAEIPSFDRLCQELEKAKNYGKYKKSITSTFTKKVSKSGDRSKRSGFGLDQTGRTTN